MRLNFTMRFIFVEFWTSFLVNNTTTTRVSGRRWSGWKEKKKGIERWGTKEKFQELFTCFILQCFHFSSISFIFLYSLIDSRETWSTSIGITEVNGEVINNKKSLLYIIARTVDERERNNTWMSVVYTTHLVIFFTIQSNKR